MTAIFPKLQTNNRDKVCEAVDSLATFLSFYNVAESCLCKWRPPIYATTQKHDWVIA